MNDTSTEAYWEKVAKGIDVLPQVHPCQNAEEFWQSGKRPADEVVAVAARHGLTGRVLHICDWGCGPGRVIKHLCRRAMTYGYDSSPAMLELLKTHCPEVEPVTCLEQKRGYFDVIFAYSVFIHHDFATGIAMLRRMASCLAADGIIAAQIPIYRSRRTPTAANDVGVWSPADLALSLTLTGLHLAEFAVNDQDFSYESIGPNHNSLIVYRSPSR
jgi:trans-aconitate methyltransferase